MADSARWDGFQFRPDDIVISAPSKSGTTWTQMICALLVFQTADLPAPLTTLSPWLDMCLRPLSEVCDQLDGQRHRRFIKTHTPLDGIPADDRVTYITVARDPRDIAASLHHHAVNFDRDVLQRLLGGVPADWPMPSSATASEVRETFLRWIDNDACPLDDPRSLRAYVRQQNLAWSRQHDPNIVLLHYSDLCRDLDREMRRLADRLAIAVAADTWRELVAAATFDRMRQRSEQLVPDERLQLFTDPAKFFHSGTSGAWRSYLTDDDLARYEHRLAALASPELVHWLHHGHAA